MPRAITKEPPKGSRLAAYLSHILADIPPDGILHDHNGEPLWRSDDPALRCIGVYSLKNSEHRWWKRPRDFVRDEIVLPAIANVDGAEAAHALKTYAPKVLDEFVALLCDAAQREATARQRRPRDPDNSRLITAIIWAAVSDGYDASRSMNANFERARLRLGLDRGVVRRTVAEVMRALATMDGPARSFFNAATLHVRATMAELDRQTGGRGPSQRVHSRAP
jgi:hypothetical protein